MIRLIPFALRLIALILVSVFAVALRVNAAPVILIPVLNPFTLYDTQIINRNDNLGQPVSADIKFVMWRDLPEQKVEEAGDRTFRSAIGLTKTGRLYHFIHLNGRNYARHLSGQNVITEFAIVGHAAELIALTKDNRVLKFSNTAWQASPLGSIVRKRIGYSSVGILATTAFSFLSASFFVSDSPALVSLVAGFGSIFSALGVGQIQLFNGVREFSEQNRQPDGFIDTGLRSTNLVDLKPEELDKIVNESATVEEWQTDCKALLSRKLDLKLLKKFDERAI